MSVILLETINHVAVVTINRPDKLNALNAEVLKSLDETVATLKNDDNVRVVVITGAGEKAFVAGADIAELHQQDEYSGKAFSELGQAVFTNIESLGKPVIAAVNGFALGGGCELALAAHIRFASNTARFGLPEITLGIIPGYGGTQRLPRLIGLSKACEFILSGEMIPAEQALQLGLVNRVIAAESLRSEALEFAQKLASQAPHALYGALGSVYASSGQDQSIGMSIEASIFGNICGTSDFKEGTQAFLEKRKPVFTGN